MTTSRLLLQFDSNPDLAAIETLAARGHRPNLLIVCSEGTAGAVAEKIAGRAAQPLRSCALPGELTLPEEATATLLLNDIAKLTRAQQQALQTWLQTSRGGGVQVVSLTETPLEMLVRTGHFDETLYYRLNVIRVTMTAALG